MMKTILVADDSRTIQHVVALAFRATDFKVIQVGDGDEALRRLEEVNPDVVLADVAMPGKNGYELCSRIKSGAATARIPVLLLAGAFEPFDDRRAEEAQADGHIKKPFDSQSLIDRVKSLTGSPVASEVPLSFAATLAARKQSGIEAPPSVAPLAASPLPPLTPPPPAPPSASVAPQASAGAGALMPPPGASRAPSQTAGALPRLDPPRGPPTEPRPAPAPARPQATPPPPPAPAASPFGAPRRDHGASGSGDLTHFDAPVISRGPPVMPSAAAGRLTTSDVVIEEPEVAIDDVSSDAGARQMMPTGPSLEPPEPPAPGRARAPVDVWSLAEDATKPRAPQQVTQEISPEQVKRIFQEADAKERGASSPRRMLYETSPTSDIEAIEEIDIDEIPLEAPRAHALAQAAEGVVARAAAPIAEKAREIVPELSHDELVAVAKEVIERVAWEVVPELAETIIRAELDRLLRGDE